MRFILYLIYFSESTSFSNLKYTHRFLEFTWLLLNSPVRDKNTLRVLFRSRLKNTYIFPPNDFKRLQNKWLLDGANMVDEAIFAIQIASAFGLSF